ncbi:Aste57867_16394 [Aphanomyces stellatus]|uniref:Aste57867_16394 protein n=1 Tax=Aphanomyces stellatus TaxID=120398 RepID=A0A485L788_9STRA|nr:hypothetical protein As57867_016337 [Aphanomyces stellatus]VFT93170.1 Aste57867_16394 [Aphanomyces stellatus]
MPPLTRKGKRVQRLRIAREKARRLKSAGKKQYDPAYYQKHKERHAKNVQRYRERLKESSARLATTSTTHTRSEQSPRTTLQKASLRAKHQTTPLPSPVKSIWSMLNSHLPSSTRSFKLPKAIVSIALETTPAIAPPRRHMQTRQSSSLSLRALRATRGRIPPRRGLGRRVTRPSTGQPTGESKPPLAIKSPPGFDAVLRLREEQQASSKTKEKLHHPLWQRMRHALTDSSSSAFTLPSAWTCNKDPKMDSLAPLPANDRFRRILLQNDDAEMAEYLDWLWAIHGGVLWTDQTPHLRSAAPVNV